MSTKSFVWILIAVVVFGAGLGGSFIAGVAVGGSDDSDDVAPLSLPAAVASAAEQPQSGALDVGDLASLRDRIQSGDFSPEDLGQLREQFGGGQGGAGGFGGFTGRGDGLSGPIERIDGNTITINTSQGSLQATISDATTITGFATFTPEDLSTGVTVTVIGQRGEDGAVEATSIIITPEGGAPFGGGGGFFRGGGGQFGGGGRPPGGGSQQ